MTHESEPLTAREQAVLHKLEQQLASDPRFARRMDRSTGLGRLAFPVAALISAAVLPALVVFDPLLALGWCAMIASIFWYARG